MYSWRYSIVLILLLLIVVLGFVSVQEYFEIVVCMICLVWLIYGEVLEFEEVMGFYFYEGNYYYFCFKDCE